jgi:hypothetical protein
MFHTVLQVCLNDRYTELQSCCCWYCLLLYIILYIILLKKKIGNTII